MEKQMAEPQLIRCAACGTLNRANREKLDQGRQPVCGRCKAPLQANNNQACNKPMVVTDATFMDKVERSPLPVLLDSWAPWCGPCRMVTPVVEALAREMPGRVRVATLNVDENPVTADRFRIRSIPSLLIFKAGREIDRIVGAQPKSEIVRRLARAIG
jgi:thioredoxin 2